MRAALIGCGRQLRRHLNRTPQNYGKVPDAYRDWGRNIEAVGAEMAYAKAMNVYYHPSLQPDDADVNGHQIRHTVRSDGHLIVHPRDHLPCVLVVGQMPAYEVVGWIAVEDAQSTEYWGTRGSQDRPAYWVPQSALHDLGAGAGLADLADLTVYEADEKWWPS